MSDRFDILTFDQQNDVMKTLDFSVGARLGAVISELGMDESVRIAPRSAKQLKRYIDGDEPPMTVLQNLCRATGASLDWLIEAEPRSKVDCGLERRLLEQERIRRNAALGSATTEIERTTNDFAIAAIDGLLEIVDKDRERLPDRSFDEGAKQRLQVRRLNRSHSKVETPRQEKKAEQVSEVPAVPGGLPHDFIALPFFDVEASAGYGAVAATLEEMRSVISFERTFLRNLGAVPDYCKVIGARGDSMTPTIPDGALIVVDLSQRDVVNGWISVINVGGDLLVKRVRRRLDGTIELVSDNPIYPIEAIGPDRIDQLTIIGRVVYFCRTP